MANRESALGRGLDSLISRYGDRVDAEKDTAAPGAGTITDLPIDQVVANRAQPRTEFAVEALNELTESLRRHGLLQPVVVRRAGDAYELVAGERRLRAARELGWDTIRCFILEIEEEQLLEWALIENIQRTDLGPIELARAYRALIDQHGLTQAELAERVGKSRSAVTNTLRLLDLPSAVKERVSRGTVSMGAARALSGIGDPELQERLSEQVETGQLSVRQVEQAASRAKQSSGQDARKESGSEPGRDPDLVDLERELTRALGTRVALRGTLEKGELRIRYFSGPQLDLLVRKLSKGDAGVRAAGSAEEDRADGLAI